MNRDKRLSKFWFLAVCLPALLIIPATGRAQSEGPKKPKFIIKWATIAPENTIWGDMIKKASREIEAASGGRLKNIWYFGAIQGDEPETIRKAAAGELQGFALMTLGLSKLSPEMTTFSIPFLFRDYREVDCVLPKILPLASKILEQKGYIMIGSTDVGFSVLFTKKNIRAGEDFQGLHFWIWSGLEIDKGLAKLYGIQNLHPLPLPEVLPALQNGVIDTVFASYYTAVALQWQTQVKYMTDDGTFGGAYCPAMLLLSKNYFESLPPDIQKSIPAVFEKYFPQLRRQIRQDEEGAKQSLLRRGIKLVEIDPAFVQKAVERSQTVFSYRDFGNSPWFFRAVVDARDQCRNSP